LKPRSGFGIFLIKILLTNFLAPCFLLLFLVDVGVAGLDLGTTSWFRLHQQRQRLDLHLIANNPNSTITTRSATTTTVAQNERSNNKIDRRKK